MKSSTRQRVRMIGSILFAGFLLSLLVSCQLFEPLIPSKPWTLVYQADFERAEPRPEWSSSRTSVTPVGDRTFLGEFDAETVHLKLEDLPSHSEVELSFDLYILRSWEGNATLDTQGTVRALGPDIWSLEVVRGPRLLYTTFSNIDYVPEWSRQSFPDSYPDGDHPARTGAVENNTLGYLYTFPERRELGTRPMDSVYRLEFTFEHTESLLWLRFIGGVTEEHTNESWGIDNIVVRVR